MRRFWNIPLSESFNASIDFSRGAPCEARARALSAGAASAFYQPGDSLVVAKDGAGRVFYTAHIPIRVENSRT